MCTPERSHFDARPLEPYERGAVPDDPVVAPAVADPDGAPVRLGELAALHVDSDDAGAERVDRPTVDPVEAALREGCLATGVAFEVHAAAVEHEVLEHVGSELHGTVTTR